MNQTICDGCRKEISYESGLTLERMDPGLASLSDPLGPWHFHNVKCVHDWAAERLGL